MKVLVYPCSMEVGGSQLNAIELAASMSERGHEVVLFGPDGVLVPMVQDLGLEYLLAPEPTSWPSTRNGAVLRGLVRDRGIDVVHGYEWGPALDLAFGVEPFTRAAAVTTVLSMSVPSIVPRHTPLVVGTADILAAVRSRPGPTYLMEPPIDTRRNAPRDTAASRRRFDVPPGEVLCVVACRLTTDLEKVHGVLVAVDVVERLALAGLPVRLLVAGEGEGRAAVEERAAAANERVGRTVVTSVGNLLDPTEAYDAADVVLGMGSSVMKGMAFAKAVVVQGERGFWRTLDEGSLPTFLETGWFGSGGAGPADLEPQLRALATDPRRRAALGDLGRRVVTERCSLEAAVVQLEDMYQRAVASRPARGRMLHELSRSAYELVKFETVQLGRRWIGPQFAHGAPAATAAP